MGSFTYLWSRSRAWRWTFSLTLLAIATALLISPWKKPTTTSPAIASYTANNNQHTGIKHLTSPPGGTSISTNSNISSPNNKTPVSLPNNTFDIAINQQMVAYGPDVEMHVIGVYKGTRENGKEDPPWWSKCDTSSPSGSKPESSEIIECHQKFAGQRTRHTITVDISRHKPMVLVLMAHEPVLWKIVTQEPGIINRVILGGYHGQDITGIPNNIPVDLYTYESSPCTTCTRKAGYIYTDGSDSNKSNKVIGRLFNITGLTPSSFQGTHKSHYFSISNGTVSQTDRLIATETRRQLDPYTGFEFTNSVTLGGETLPLPEGVWRGMVFERISSSRGVDELLVLANIEAKKLSQLMAARVRADNNTNGFRKNPSCNKQTSYITKKINNESYGMQSCYWLEHLTSPWEKAIFKLTSVRLSASGVTLPNIVINAGFHEADKKLSKTIHYYLNPEKYGITTLPSNWRTSPWHPDRIKSHPDMLQVVEDYSGWAKTWFQIFTTL